VTHQREQASYQAVLLDIEGTTTSISFVYDQLFPYARRALAAFLADRWCDPAVQRDVALVQAQAEADRRAGEPAPPVPGPADADAEARRAALVANLLWQMDGDRKTTGLKGLQGRIWEAGYAAGELEAHLFEDVPPALRAWRGRGVPVCIYSSGSIAAQELLFGHTAEGDLRPLLSGYFDTTTGPKREAASYVAIAAALGLPPGAVLFVSDSLAEAEAAAAAGMQVALSRRPGNPPVGAHPFAEVTSLAEL
jgi:2,3-diketo-5-methylthio-1-phosphopentane phosphatase